jgi:uncharacterized protein YbjT (DUF2867 family)
MRHERGVPRVLVTGASGNVGREVVRALAARGAFTRAATRDGAGAEHASEAVAFDFTDPGTYRAAAAGCDAMFLLRPPPLANVRETLIPFIDVARLEGVRHIAFLSVTGAGSNRFIPHHAVERRLLAASGDCTLLRPGFFAQNLGDAYRRDIVLDSRLYVPAGNARVRWVDVRDVAVVAAAVLCEPEAHRRKAYELSGLEALSFGEVARILQEALHRPVRYERASIPGYALHLRRRRQPWSQVAVQTFLHVAMRFGPKPTDDTLGALLGRAPRTLREYVLDHTAVWSPQEPEARRGSDVRGSSPDPRD